MKTLCLITLTVLATVGLVLGFQYLSAESKYSACARLPVYECGSCVPLAMYSPDKWSELRETNHVFFKHEQDRAFSISLDVCMPGPH